MSNSTSESGEWYFDLRKGVAVPASQRGNAENLLGPYSSKAAAENWKRTVKERNDAWEKEDERWDHLGEEREG
jgi:hypothetical protein